MRAYMVIYNIIAKLVIKAYICDTIGRIHVRPKQLYQGRSSALANADPNREELSARTADSKMQETMRVSAIPILELNWLKLGKMPKTPIEPVMVVFSANI